jgi:hypothetical protein
VITASTHAGAVDGGVAASRIAPPATGILEAAGRTEELEVVFLPPILQVLRALDVAPEPGWTAVIGGRGLRGDLLARLSTTCGARRLVRLAVEPPPEASNLPVPVLDVHAPDIVDRLAELLPTGGPVVAFDTQGEPATVLALLGSLPARSHLVLLECAPNAARGAVNFYRDVHRKNAIVHGIPRSSPASNGDVERARRILRYRLRPEDLPNLVRVNAAAGLEPRTHAAALLVLDWPSD